MKDLYGNIDESAEQERLYQQAIAIPLETKVEMAIAMLQLYGRNNHLDFANSGGKDSTVIMALAKMAGLENYSSHYGNTTIDPPELIWFLKRNFPETKWISVGKHLTISTHEHAGGLPTRRGKWCCDIYKHNHGVGMQVVGIRAEESSRRKGLWKQVNTMNGNTVLAPILYFTEQDVWDFIKGNDLPYCSLYDEVDENGKKLFRRLGCVGCPNGKRAMEFKRWPRYEHLWKKGGRKWWEKYSQLKKADGSSYFAAKFPTFEAYWSWWMEEKNVNDTDTPDCQMFLW